MSAPPRYHRILLKLSGEALSQDDRRISPDVLRYLAGEIRSVTELGVQVGVVIGGGNLVRGEQMAELGMDRVKADQMGMLGTVMNAIALATTLEREGVPADVQSSVAMDSIVTRFSQVQAVRWLEEGKVVVFGGGTGNPFFTTDTAAALRGAEIRAQCVMKATSVDGIYDKDPKKFADAVKYDRLNFQRAIEERLKVMDSTALSLCRDNRLPIVVFRLRSPGHLRAAVLGEPVGTTVDGD